MYLSKYVSRIPMKFQYYVKSATAVEFAGLTKNYISLYCFFNLTSCNLLPFAPYGDSRKDVFIHLCIYSHIVKILIDILRNKSIKVAR